MGLHCEYHPASTLFGYFKQDQSNRMDSIPGGDDATGASGTGPVMGYSLKLKCFILFIFVLFLNTCTCFVSLTMVMEILFIYMFNFRIKICPKIHICLTHLRVKQGLESECAVHSGIIQKCIMHLGSQKPLKTSKSGSVPRTFTE